MEVNYMFVDLTAWDSSSGARLWIMGWLAIDTSDYIALFKLRFVLCARWAFFFSWSFTMAWSCRSTKLYRRKSDRCIRDFCISFMGSKCFEFSSLGVSSGLEYSLISNLLSLSTQSNWDEVRFDRVICIIIRYCFMNFTRSSCFITDYSAWSSIFLYLYILRQHYRALLD